MSLITALAQALREREISSRDLVTDALLKIKKWDRKLNSFITVTGDAALEAADARDEELARGFDRGVFHGIPIAYKDLIRTKGIHTTGGSKILANYVPTRDADVVTGMSEAGAVCMGKTGLHEFAYGITSNNPHFGAIHNPWDLQRISGGSSGGSAVAVAAGIVPMAVGTDTGGSIRIPASFCGVVGFKPSFGRVSVKGVLPLGFSQDHVGPMTRTVRDAALAFQEMAEEPSGYVPGSSPDPAELRIGYPTTFFRDRVDTEVESAVQSAILTMAGRKARIIELPVPDMEALLAAAGTCLLVEAAVALRPYLDRRNDFGADVLGRIEQGLGISGVDYIEAQRARRRIGRQFARVFEEVDCIFTPTTPITAPKIGQTEVEVGGAKGEVRAVATRFTRPFNALGLPAISIPCGFSSAGLPIGLQIVSAARQEDLLLHIAAATEDTLGLIDRVPALA